MTSLGTIIGRGVTGSRPAAGTPGALYFDTTRSVMQRDNGSTWDDVEGAGGGGGGITQSYLGYNTIGGSWEAMVGDRVYAKKITLASAGLLAGVSAYIKGNGINVGSLVGAVFTDNAGVPGNVIAYDPVDASYDVALSTTGRWLACGLPSLYLPAASYWVAVDAHALSASGAISIAYDGSGADYIDSVGNPWFRDGGSFTNSTNTYSLRATLIQ